MMSSQIDSKSVCRNRRQGCWPPDHLTIRPPYLPELRVTYPSNFFIRQTLRTPSSKRSTCEWATLRFLADPVLTFFDCLTRFLSFHSGSLGSYRERIFCSLRLASATSKRARLTILSLGNCQLSSSVLGNSGKLGMKVIPVLCRLHPHTPAGEYYIYEGILFQLARSRD